MTLKAVHILTESKYGVGGLSSETDIQKYRRILTR